MLLDKQSCSVTAEVIFQKRSQHKRRWHPKRQVWKLSFWVYYCRWKKSCTTWDVENPVNTWVKYLSTGAGFLPSTVELDIFEYKLGRFHQGHLFSSRSSWWFSVCRSCKNKYFEQLSYIATGTRKIPGIRKDIYKYPLSFAYCSGQFITTSAEVTPNGGLVRESPPKWP